MRAFFFAANEASRREDAGASDDGQPRPAPRRQRSTPELPSSSARPSTILLARAELARVQGDDGRRQTLRREAHRLFVEMGATGHAERLAKELGSS